MLYSFIWDGISVLIGFIMEHVHPHLRSSVGL